MNSRPCAAAAPAAKPIVLCLMLPVVLLAVLGMTRRGPLLPTPMNPADLAVPVTYQDTEQARHAAARKMVRRLEAEVARTGGGHISPIDLQLLRGMVRDDTAEQ